MIEQHEWPEVTGSIDDIPVRCIHCGTPRAQHEKVWQPCPRQHAIAYQRPEERRVAAVDDVDVIHTRLLELEAERLAILNAPAEASASFACFRCSSAAA